MNKVNLRKPPTVVLIAIIAVMVLVSGTVAWLTVGKAFTNRVYSLSNFNAYAHVWFEGSAPITKDGDGTIIVDVSDSDASNYIGKLRVTANYKGRGAFYLRLKMIQQWTKDGKILQSNAVFPYTLWGTPYDSGTGGPQAAWFDNRLDDFCIYYAKRIQVANENYTSTPIITGIDILAFNAMKPDGASLKVAFTLEAVQVNRYPQFWGIDTLPWPSAPVTTTAVATTS